jgi:hypothetical protein
MRVALVAANRRALAAATEHPLSSCYAHLMVPPLKAPSGLQAKGMR